MMVKIGNFLFHYRNILFPFFYLTLFIPSPKIFDNIFISISLGLFLAFLGQGIRILTIGLAYVIRGGSKRRIFAKSLVTEGIYAHSRNPLYWGNILQLAGLGIMANSLFFICFVFPFFIFAYQAIVLAEENFLLNKFGDEYRMYMHRVKRWIPRVSGLSETLKSTRFNWKRVLLKEYNATYLWTAGAVLIVIKDLFTLPDKTVFITLKPGFLGILSVLTILYLVVMYLKKVKMIRD